jgi:hypothetical protein
VEERVPFHTNALDIDTFHAINHATIAPLSGITTLFAGRMPLDTLVVPAKVGPSAVRRWFAGLVEMKSLPVHALPGIIRSMFQR